MDNIKKSSKEQMDRCGKVWLVGNYTQILRYRISEITSYDHQNIQILIYKYESVIPLLIPEGLQKYNKSRCSQGGLQVNGYDDTWCLRDWSSSQHEKLLLHTSVPSRKH